MNFNFILTTLVLFSISSILPYSSSQDINAYTQQFSKWMSQDLGPVQEGAKKNGGEGSSNIHSLIQSVKTVQAKCVQKLMPCQEYFKNSKTDIVAQSCCQPLRVVISEDMDCICGVVKGQGLLKNINLTLDNVFNVAKACGAEPDYSACDDYAPAQAPGFFEFDSLAKPETPSPESSQAKSPDTATATTPAPTPRAADGSGGHMEKSSLIVMVLTFMLLAI